MVTKQVETIAWLNLSLRDWNVKFSHKLTQEYAIAEYGLQIVVIPIDFKAFVMYHKSKLDSIPVDDMTLVMITI